ncbi:unnamed protein product [Schistocephalus solidus]|uniref:Extensin-like n=1 Tax=Schistocephalus solidus TaxID=70667 RepID=A0A183T923_SCHSO|nr:unnamed protein product [Schistocephalus solidus]
MSINNPNGAPDPRRILPASPPPASSPPPPHVYKQPRRCSRSRIASFLPPPHVYKQPQRCSRSRVVSPRLPPPPPLPRMSINNPTVLPIPRRILPTSASSMTPPAHTNNTSNHDAPSNVNSTTVNPSELNSVPTCLHGNLTFTSRVGLVG